jgi:hypothetical protein
MTSKIDKETAYEWWFKGYDLFAGFEGYSPNKDDTTVREYFESDWGDNNE